LLVIVRVNLLKTSRNLPVISDSWESVAEKRLLGLRIDAIRSHFAARGVPMARATALSELAGDCYAQRISTGAARALEG
jgi:hypothetical protein